MATGRLVVALAGSSLGLGTTVFALVASVLASVPLECAWVVSFGWWLMVLMVWRSPGSDFGPADEQEWTDGVEGGFAVGAGDEGVGDVQGEGGEAGEDE
jgi:hypothetical protein